MLGALGAITATLSTDKRVYRVGEKPMHTIVGGVPGAAILWTSFKDGHNTEFQTSLNQVIGVNGTVEIEGPAFTQSDLGAWQRQVLMIDQTDGSPELAQTSYVVTAVSAPTPTPTPAPSGNLLDQKVTILGMEIPTVALIAVGIGALFVFGGKK